MSKPLDRRGAADESPLHHPAIPSEPLAALDPLASNAALDSASPQELPAAGDSVALIRMQLLLSLPPAASGGLDRWNGSDEPLEEHRVVLVGGAYKTGERDASSVEHNMALRA